MKPRGKCAGRARGVGGCLLLGLALLGAVSASGAAPFEVICDGKATALSEDGSVVVGIVVETGETWRWTEKTGRVLLEGSGGTTSEIERGTPDVSGDGRQVFATIFSEGSGNPSMGLWTEKDGWTSPSPTESELSTGSLQHHTAWGMIGDGSILLGNAQFSDGNIGAAVWNPPHSLVVLGEPGRSSQAHDANRDGTVVVGWSESVTTGIWQPAAWIQGREIVLSPTRYSCEAMAVNPGGNIIVGQSYDESLDRKTAALWLNSDFGWVQEWLGALPGTIPGYGQAKALDLTDDGHIIVGFNQFDPDRSAGFIWTLEDGMSDAKEYLANHDVELPEGFRISSVTGISPDGRYLIGHGQDTTFWPLQIRSFLIRVDDFPRAEGRKRILPAGTGIPNPFKTRKMD